MSTKYPQGIITPTPPFKSTTAQNFSGVWTLEQIANNYFYYKQGISNSLRFRSSATAYLNRTPSVAGNQKTWTFSAWVKRGQLGATQIIAEAGTSGTTFTYIAYFNASDQLVVLDSTVSGVSSARTSAAVFRDPSAWYHIVVNLDATNSVCNGYVNGVAQTFTGTQPSNQNWAVNSAIEHRIGRAWGVNTNYFDGYMADINFIDGQALDPSYFGQISPITGVWSPAKYVGSYGTNGFYLPFTNTTSTTTLCADASGNSNNWTPNNISLTAGSTYDSMLDSPTSYDNGGNGVGNYAVLNPLKLGSSLSLSNANLTVAASGSSITNQAFSSMAVPSGKWYFEVNIATNTNANATIGVATPLASQNTFAGSDANSWGFGPYINTYYTYTNGVQTTVASSGLVGTGTFGFAFDASAGTFWATDQNGNWLSSGNPATGANPLISSITTTFGLMASVGHYSIGSQTTSQNANFGQRPFAYTPPSGFKALNTFNLSQPTIANGANHMAATTYTGTGSAQTIINAANSVSFQPDFVWGKARSTTTSNSLYDSVRGTGLELFSDSTSAEVNRGTSSGVQAFNANGFTVAGAGNLNTSAATYVAWQWKAGGTAVTNTAGSITSQVSANTTAGFSVVTYTGTGTANSTVGHGLGVAPGMILVKQRNGSTYAWNSYHSALNAGYYIQLNTTSAADNSVAIFPSGGVTSTVFNNGGSGATIYNNASGGTYVAYCFAAIPGYSAFGSYTGNGSTDGPFIYTGFRPRFLLFKRTDTTANWVIYDTSRNTYNEAGQQLYPNLSDAESGPSGVLDILSNGFKLRTTGAVVNSGTIIYAAFAENPFKYSLAR